jgi:uncharacterized SAM-binding protein YcdF (DUF218 family)
LNELFLSLGISGWKPVVAALVLPPTPWIVLVVWGAIWLRQRRPAGWLFVMLACMGLWFGASTAVGEMLSRTLLAPVPPLGPAELATLKQGVAAKPGETAVVVLGGGRETLAPEYGVSNLAPASLTRLRYGLWLARETGAPVAFAGGVGYGAVGSAPEAEIAARIAAQEFNRPLKWTESRSRDTRENATFTVGLLRPAGIKRIVVVTHGTHMPRAVRAFEEAARNSGGGIEIQAAPMGLSRPSDAPWLRWLPSGDGQQRVREVLREWIGTLAGA